jgi:phosphatidylglycerophosphatase A
VLLIVLLARGLDLPPRERLGAAWFDHLLRAQLRSARRPAPPAEASTPPVPSGFAIETSPRPEPRAASGPVAGRFAWCVATACGAGLSPIAPGTAGSAVGVLLFPVFAPFPLALYLLSVAAITALGIWAADRMEAVFGVKDDGRIVIDEVAGQLLTLAPLVALGASRNWLLVVTGFVLFRVFDVWKPGPARWLEANLPGGAGVVMDDVMAGAFAALALAAIALGTERWLG